MMHNTTGRLKYSILDTKQYKGFKLIVEEIDPGIARFYRSLIPKFQFVRPQMYNSHISVVRKETPTILDFWGEYDGKLVEVTYDSYVHNDDKYYWLNVYSKDLENIRAKLGLQPKDKYLLPPEGFTSVFHMTIGNCKEVIDETI